MLIVATWVPTGWIEPWKLSQIMISAPVFWPSVRGVGSSQMSYAASQVPRTGSVIDAWC